MGQAVEPVGAVDAGVEAGVVPYVALVEGLPAWDMCQFQAMQTRR